MKGYLPTDKMLVQMKLWKSPEDQLLEDVASEPLPLPLAVKIEEDSKLDDIFELWNATE